MGNILPKILFIASACLVFSFVTPSSAAQKNKKQAQIYRDQGFEAQRAGNLDMALSYYQRALEKNSEYADVYNDIGIVLEAKGETVAAKNAYLRALALDSKLLSASYNVAALYENEGEIAKAAYYWKMRVQSGEWSDVWTWRAKEHLDALQATGKLQEAGIPLEGDGAFGFGSNTKRDAQYHLHKARRYIMSGNYVLAHRELTTAYLLDQNNHEIGELLDVTQRRVLLYKK